MATEVKHGPRPKFRAPLAKGRYGLSIQGHYTKKDGLTAAGVHTVAFESNRPEKQRAEMLGMRTAFVCWFVDTWIQKGGTWVEAVEALTHYPYDRRWKRSWWQRLKREIHWRLHR